VLVSCNNSRKFKKKSIAPTRRHSSISSPSNDFKIIGDCGAFTYKDEKNPPYKTSPVLQQ
jgi:hypothetical protein